MTTFDPLPNSPPQLVRNQPRGNYEERFGILAKYSGVCGVCGASWTPGAEFSSCQSPAVPLRTRGSAEAVVTRRTAPSQPSRMYSLN